MGCYCPWLDLYASGTVHPLLAGLYALTLLFDARRYWRRRRASKRDVDATAVSERD